MSSNESTTADTGAGYENLRGVLVAPGDQATTWYYRAAAPTLATDANGRVQFTFINAGPMTMFACTGMWGVATATLDAVRADLAARAGVPVAQLNLLQAPVEVGEVSLMLGDGQGGYVQLGKTRSSGAPPYHAAFNIMLDADQAARVRKALSGERGWLELRYAITAAAPSRHTASTTTSDAIDVEVSLRADGEQADAGLSLRSQVSTHVERGQEQQQTQHVSADAADWGLPKP